MTANTSKWVATSATSSANASLTVNGDPFFANGVCYQAVPWGGSAGWSPYGDFLSAPWNEVWERDFPLMRAGGVNLIRTYNMPLTQDGVAHDHTASLAAAWNGGTDPIYVLVGFGVLNNLALYDPWDQGADARASAQAVFQATVDAYKDDPAVMGFIIGNEVNNVTTIKNSQFWTFLNGLAKFVSDNAPDKLSIMCLVDDSMDTVTAGDSQMPDLDLWGINSYRGSISGAGQNNFTNMWNSYAAVSKKPLLISEWGAPASTHDSDGNLAFTGTVADDLNTYITGHYNDVCLNATTTTSDGGKTNPNAANWAAVCVGSTYFEWSDELWKLDAQYPSETCSATVQNPGVATNSAFPGGWDDEECFGLHSVTPVVYTPPTGNPVQPANRPPGPPPNTCPGPWNFEATPQAPYPADQLTARPSWTTLSDLFQN